MTDAVPLKLLLHETWTTYLPPYGEQTQTCLGVMTQNLSSKMPAALCSECLAK